MIKLLQKYKMYILVVVGIFVMISFLLADAIKQIGQYSMENSRVFTVDGQKVSRADLQTASNHIEGLKRVLGPDSMKSLDMDENANQWQLAAIAAEKAGVVGGPADGRATARQLVLQQIATEAYRKGFNDWRAYLKSTGNLTDEQVDQRIEQAVESAMANAGRSGSAASEGANAFAEYRGFQRLRQSYGEIPQTSENRLASEARRLLDIAVIKYVYVPITQGRIAAASAPTDQEIQAQFDKFKDTTVGTGEGGAGYRQNDRITYTWFMVDKAGISKAVRVDPIEVSKRVLDRTKGGEGAADKVDPTLRAQIESEIRGELTQRAIDDLTNALKAEFLKQSALLPDKDGYKVLPADWKKPDMTAIVASAVQRMATEKKVTIPLPEVHTVSTPQDIPAYAAEPGIGHAAIPRPGQQMPTYLGEILFAAKEFGKPAGRLPAQVGIPIPTAFTGPGGNLYFAMLDSALPSASPKGLDEVRPQVEADLRKAKALAQLKTDIEARLAPIANLGMSQAPDQLAVLGFPGLSVLSGETRRGGYSQNQFGQQFSYLIESTPGLPAVPEVQEKTLVDDAVARAEKLDPSMHVDNDSATERTFVHTLTSGKGVALVQVTGLKPLTLETFRQIAANPALRARIEAMEITEDQAMPHPFRTETLIKRFNVSGLEPKKGEEEP